MQSSALIGHTGFVGSNLMRQTQFGACFNSSNIAHIAGNEFDLVVCAGVNAAMWKANAAPEEDWRSIERLLDPLCKARIARLVLISTIAVFDDSAAGYDENTAAYEWNLAYGRHRRRLETALADRFEGLCILRLPALFGPGLKKNFIYDLLNPIPSFLKPTAFDEVLDHTPPPLLAYLRGAYRYKPGMDMYGFERRTDRDDPNERDFIDILKASGLDSRRFTNDRSRFQFYDLTQLWRDITRCLDNDLAVVNIAAEPLEAGRVCEALTGARFENSAPQRVDQDIRSVHAGLWGGAGGYLFSAEDTLERLVAFAGEEERAAA